MTAHLFKGCAAVICDPHSVLRDVDLLVEGPKITAIGKGLSLRLPQRAGSGTVISRNPPEAEDPDA